MTQDTEARRSAPPRKDQSVPPGRGLTMTIAVISGVVCWFWPASGRANSPKSTALNVTDLTGVEEREVAGALTTMSVPNAMLAQFREGKDGGCRRPLAWVSLASAPGEALSNIRLIFGTCCPPAFEASATPVRGALPFPAPYETGHGALTAIDVEGSTTVSLLPAWRVSVQDGKMTHAVAWRPVKNCSPRNG